MINAQLSVSPTDLLMKSMKNLSWQPLSAVTKLLEPGGPRDLPLLDIPVTNNIYTLRITIERGK